MRTKQKQFIFGPILMVHDPVSYARENQRNNRFNYEFLQQGLIGQHCLASVFVEGIECESFLDKDKVTTLSKIFYLTHLSSLPIQPIHALFEVEGSTPWLHPSYHNFNRGGTFIT